MQSARNEGRVDPSRCQSLDSHWRRYDAGSIKDEVRSADTGHDAWNDRTFTLMGERCRCSLVLIATSLCHAQAFECPGCGRPMRYRSYLTPGAQTAVGALTLIACFAWPPLIVILILYVFGRYLARARRGGTRSLIVAAGAVIALGVACTYVAPPSLALVILFLALAALAWLANLEYRGEEVAGAGRDQLSASAYNRRHDLGRVNAAV